ncbi:MAG: type II toxin-antitoxin system VapB family antitoxin [Thermoanaerobaculia bacterium]
MFTSLDIDEKLFTTAWRLSGLKTKKAFFEEMMRIYIRLHEQAEVRSLRGKLAFDETPPATRGKRRANPR